MQSQTTYEIYFPTHFQTPKISPSRLSASWFLHLTWVFAFPLVTTSASSSGNPSCLLQAFPAFLWHLVQLTQLKSWTESYQSNISISWRKWELC